MSRTWLPNARLGGCGGGVELDINADVACILIITNSYSLFWVGSIDAESASVFPVNHSFQGLYINSGQHSVILSATLLAEAIIRLVLRIVSQPFINWATDLL